MYCAFVARFPCVIQHSCKITKQKTNRVVCVDFGTSFVMTEGGTCMSYNYLCHALFCLFGFVYFM